MTDELDADLRFAILPEWVIYSDAGDRAIRLYAVLDRFAGESGKAWPSRETLAARLGCSRESVDRAVRELRKIGAVEVVHRRLEDGQPTSNLYLLRRIPPSSPVTNVVVTADDQGGRTADDQVAAPVTTKGEPLNENQGKETRRATRIPDEFFITADMAAWAEREGMRVDLRRETAKFVDYWRAKAGRDARKLDWASTWRNWIRRADENAPALRGGLRPTNPQRSDDAIDRVLFGGTTDGRELTA